MLTDFKKIFSILPLPVFILQDGFFRSFNSQLVQVTGYYEDELIKKPFADLVHPEDWPRVADFIKKLTEAEVSPEELQFRLINNQQKAIFVRAAFCSAEFNDCQALFGYLATECRQMVDKLNNQKAYFQQLFENSPDGIAILDIEDRVVNVNRSFEKLFQFSAEEIKGSVINEVIVPEDLSEETSFDYGNISAGEVIQEESVRKRKDKSIVNVSILAYSIIIDNKLVGTYVIYRDITERKKTEEQLKYLSLHDSLTGLYNRAYFQQELRRLEEGRSNTIGIVICDVDGLKFVNDILGHDSGDAMLIAAANVIKESFRGNDMVARVGGDEFAILLPNSDNIALEKASHRVQHSVAQYNALNPRIPLSISIGFASSGEVLTDLNCLCKVADNNMYRDKQFRSPNARNAIMQTLMKALEVRDYINEGHGERMKVLVKALAEAIGLPDHCFKKLGLLAQFHDIGKVGITDRILFKQGALTFEEAVEIQRHCEIGSRISRSSSYLASIADLIYKHHEWWNGNGYPLGLKGEEIPLDCRILAIADAYDAMTNGRPYRNALSSEEALAVLRNSSGIQFDPRLVSLFIQIIENNSEV